MLFLREIHVQYHILFLKEFHVKGDKILLIVEILFQLM